MDLERVGGAGGVFPFTGLMAITLTSGVSVYRAAAAGDVGSAAFVCASYAALLLLFRSLRAYERLPPPGAADDDNGGGRRRRRLRRRALHHRLLLCSAAWMVLGASALLRAVADPAVPETSGIFALGGFMLWAGGVALLVLAFTVDRFPMAARRAAQAVVHA